MFDFLWFEALFSDKSNNLDLCPGSQFASLKVHVLLN